MTDDLDDQLRNWGERARADARPADVPFARLRRRRAAPALAVGLSAVVVLAVVAAAVAIRDTPSSEHSSAPAASGSGESHPSQPTTTLIPPGPTDYDALVVHDGDTVRVNARVLALPGGPVRACVPLPVATSTSFDLFRYCDDGLDATGVDLDNLADRRTQDGAVEGDAELTGTYQHGTIAVTEQSTTKAPTDPYRDPPCPAPAGGWPTGARDADPDPWPVEAYRRTHPGAIVEIAFARPSSSQVLLVVLANTDPAAIDAALRPSYGERLCVIQATVTHDQVQAALDLFDRQTQLGTDTGVYDWGGGISTDWQLTADITLVRVTPEAASVADAQPPGIVQLHPWITPLSK